MAGQRPSPTNTKASQSQKRQPLRVLLVDGGPEIQRLLEAPVSRDEIVLSRAQNLSDAKRLLHKTNVDVALIDVDMPEVCAEQIAAELASRPDHTQMIAIGGQPDYQRAMGLIRAGASDFIARSIGADEMDRCLDHVRRRHRTRIMHRRRIRRLQRVCRKLNQMRKDVRQQVDILCQDLVAAYQELAVQMNQVVQTSEFAGMIRQELDLEQFLRKTLEFMLQKTGPTNAAIFLPASNDDEYTLGGYINYDCSTDSAEVLLQYLGDIVAPRIAEHGQTVHMTDNAALTAWMDQEVTFLRDNHVIAFSCDTEEESLAIMMLFRDEHEPYEPAVIELCDAMAPMLGEHLARLVRVHHRHLDEPDEDDGDLAWGNAA